MYVDQPVGRSVARVSAGRPQRSLDPWPLALDLANYSFKAQKDNSKLLNFDRLTALNGS